MKVFDWKEQERTYSTHCGIGTPCIMVKGQPYVHATDLSRLVDSMRKPGIDRALLEQILTDCGHTGVLNMLRRGMFDV